MPEAIVLKDVALCRDGRPVIDGLNLSFGDHGVTAIMGPNGAGKSLTLRLVAGLIAPDRGTITYRDGKPQPRDLAMVFQSPVMLRRSVQANLRHALKLQGMQGAELRARIQEVLHMGDLSDLADRPARYLSGGEKQRLAMVRALAGRPRFLLLDEPTASLDPNSTAAIERLVLSARQDGSRIIMITHDRYQAERLADDVTFLHKGRLIETGQADSFFGAPVSVEARAYLKGELLT